KSVGRQTAQLFASLDEPSRLDASLMSDAPYREDIIDLILDGILEIEIGGAFCSGADAFRIVASELPDAIDRGRIGRLSREALQHAEDLSTRDAAAITNALYLYHRMPRTRAWESRCPDRDAVLRASGAPWNRGVPEARTTRNRRIAFVGRRPARLRARVELARTRKLASLARAHARRRARVCERRDASGRRAMEICNRARAAARRRRRHLDA